MKVSPAADCTFKVVFKLGGESLYLTKEYKLEEGKTYYFYGNGTKLPIYYLGLDY